MLEAENREQLHLAKSQWEKAVLQPAESKLPPPRQPFTTLSGIPIPPLATPLDAATEERTETQ